MSQWWYTILVTITKNFHKSLIYNIQWAPSSRLFLKQWYESRVHEAGSWSWARYILMLRHGLLWITSQRLNSLWHSLFYKGFPRNHLFKITEKKGIMSYIYPISYLPIYLSVYLFIFFVSFLSVLSVFNCLFIHLFLCLPAVSPSRHIHKFFQALPIRVMKF